MKITTFIKEFAKGALIGYLAWIEEGAVDRIIVGGVLLSLLALHMILLDEVFTAQQVGRIPEAANLLALMIFWYIANPVAVYRRAREETIEEVEEVVSS